jgi:hypothetical protein
MKALARRLRAFVYAAALSGAAAAAQAGRPCETQPLDVHSIERGMELAAATARRLDATGAQVVVLARAGQDLGRYGLRYSHLGLAYREPAKGERAATWRVVHKLNHCGTAEAAVYRQLLPLLRDNWRVTAWHTPHYNMVAYPWSQRYQQSNQWALETLAGAMEPHATTRAQAQAWLQLRDYRPTTLHLGALTRLGARMTAANVAFDDHPNSKRFADRIETVTVDSVFAWLQRSGLGGAEFVVR